MVDQLISTLRAVVGRDAVLNEPEELIVYECDGLPQHKYPPRAVVFPRATEEVAAVVRALAALGVPFAPRGAGTGLSGGALARDRGVIIELARMRRLLEIDPENRLAVVETGLVNAQLSRAASRYGLHYVPDPSSQATCTIGGNLAENAGGIHCLKYGMTVDHVLAARVVLPDGSITDLGGEAEVGAFGYDLLGVFIGSEGTFGIATEATVRLAPIPPAVRTLLADFTEIDDASRAVSAIIAAGLVPAALEMVDGVTIRAVEQSVFAAGLPVDAEAALLVELDGLEAGLDDEAARAEAICRQYGARSVRRAADENERKRLWAARKGAFGAMGRISPDLMLQDAVVPRSRLLEVLAETYRIGAKYHLKVANVFHAGDGNLHPYICFDGRNPDEVKRVKEAGREMMETCVRAGGTITGEHGVGLDKMEYLPLIFSADDMDAMLRLRAAFDPQGICNPGKIIPTSRACGEARGARRPEPEAEAPERKDAETSSDTARRFAPPPQIKPGRPLHAGKTFDPEAARSRLASIVGDEHVRPVEGEGPRVEVAPARADEACEILRLAAAEQWAVVPAGAGTWLDAGNPLRRADVVIRTSRLARIIEHEPADLIATAEAGVTLGAFNAVLGDAGQWLPLDPPGDERVSLGGVVATGLAGAQSLGYGAPRNHVIGMRVATASGQIIKAGGRVVKNVAGYDLCKLFTGSFGTLGLALELTFKLRPRPSHEATVLIWAGDYRPLLATARAIIAARLLPVAAELLSPAMARALAPGSSHRGYALLVRFAGPEKTVAHQISQSQAMIDGAWCAGIEAITPDARLWRALAAAPLQVQTRLTYRAAVRPARLARLIDELESLHEGPANSRMWHAGAGDGRLRVIETAAEPLSAAGPRLARLRAVARQSGGALMLESAPRKLKEELDAWGGVGPLAALMGRVKLAFDPDGLFSPGRFTADV
jgi:glycolate oxidase subunit GlcD